MVDITKGVSSIQGVQSQTTNKTQSSEKTSGKESGTSSVGEVELSISDEALSLSQAETTAKNVSKQLENTDQTLSRAGDLEELLA